jgi:hypothetical protein
MKVLGCLTGILLSLPLPVLASEGLAWMKSGDTVSGGYEINHYYCLHYKSTNSWFKLRGITDAITVPGVKCYSFGILGTDDNFIAPIGQPGWLNTIDFNKKYVKNNWL